MGRAGDEKCLLPLQCLRHLEKFIHLEALKSLDPYNSNILARLDYKSCFVLQMTPVFTKRWKDAGYAMLVSLGKSHYFGHLLTDL